jgi:hypothetical protein
MVLIFESERNKMGDPEHIVPGIHEYFHEDHVFEEGSLGGFVISYDPNARQVDVERKRNKEIQHAFKVHERGERL